MPLKPKYTLTLEGRAFVRGYLDVEADTPEEAQAKAAHRLGDVLWHYNGLDESAGVTADIGGPGLHGVPSIHGVQIIKENRSG